MHQQQEESLLETFNKFLAGLNRRRWWLILPACLIALSAAVVSLVIPDKYESEATILVEPQEVPERYVTANTTTDVREALLGMTDTILSRTQLLHIIDEFHLYSDHKGLTPEQLVDLMRKNITIAPLRNSQDPKDLNAFTISFTGLSPNMAQSIATKLTDLFITESDKSREKQSADTTGFLSDTLTVAAADLKQQEERVREFKMSALGELPEQQQGNLEILAGLHSELQNTMSNLGRAREQQTYLESLLSQYETLATASGGASGPAGSNAQDAIRAELGRLQGERADLLSRYTPEYPDVVKVDHQIKETEAMLEAARAEAAADAAAAASAAATGKKPATPQGNATIAQVKSQLEANRIEIQNQLADQKRVEASIAQYEQRLNLTPVREQQLSDLLRGYDQSKREYDDVLSKKTQSELATNLERRQQGERFNIIDPPSLPIKPVSPDHIKISLGGLVGGLFVGLALAMFVESKDHSLFSEKDLRAAFSFPLMLGLPVILREEEIKKTKRRKSLEWVAATALILLVGVAEFYVYWRS